MGVTSEPDGWIVGVAPHCTTISPDRDTVFTFDLEGRPLSWYEGGRVYKRSLASTVHGRVRVGGARRRWIARPDETAALFAAVLRRVAAVPAERTHPGLGDRLDDILRWTPETLLAERDRFRAAYRPVTILPPDQYLAVVLQATHGCTWNRCTFCNFYQDRPFATRSHAEFLEHLGGVAALLGRAAGLRRRIFLADGNALVLNNARLTPKIEAALERFPGRPLYGFIDVFTGERKRADDWHELRSLGLERVYIGLETGHDPLLHWINKPGTAADAVALVAALKRADVNVSVILMCGVGGRRFAAAHVEDTLASVAAMPLGPGDLAYLSPFVEHPDSVYARRAAQEGLERLTDAERDRQRRALRDGIRRVHAGLRVASYDIREFVY